MEKIKKIGVEGQAKRIENGNLDIGLEGFPNYSSRIGLMALMLFHRHSGSLR
jgi:hypothetical protein